MTQTTKRSASSVADEVKRLQSLGHEELRVLAAETWERLAKVMGIQDWAVDVKIVPSSAITSDNIDQTEASNPFQMGTSIFVGSKRINLLISTDYPYHEDSVGGGFEEVMLHEMGHVLATELGLDWMRDKAEDKKDIMQFEERMCDRIATIVMNRGV